VRSVWLAAPRATARVMVLTVLLVAGLLAGSGAGWAAPTAPTPPPPSPSPNPNAPSNPSDDDLAKSRKGVTDAAGEVGRLNGKLTEVQARSEALHAKLEDKQEQAKEALDAEQAAEAESRAAAVRVQTSRAETQAASAAIEEAHRRLDEFITAAYLQGVDAGALGQLIEASGPDDLVRRAELTEALATDQRAALDSLERARVAKANADSLARAAELQAKAAEATAEQARKSADQQVDAADDEVRLSQNELAQVESLRVAIEKQLDELTAKDAGLRAQRQRYLDYQAQLAAQAAAAQSAAVTRLRGSGVGTGSAAKVIDHALDMLGTVYAWGGGSTAGPSRGIRDGGVADRYGDFRKTGFDCSGLMLYAFAKGAGIKLPRYSGNQYNAGKKVPLSQMKPGDMLFWSNGKRIHHVALYIGNDQMIEAPESGGRVRVTAVRYGDGLMPYATRML
jgi:cell wall-associated NlpC family hydrolase